MLEYLADGSRSYSEPYFTVSEVSTNAAAIGLLLFLMSGPTFPAKQLRKRDSAGSGL